LKNPVKFIIILVLSLSFSDINYPQTKTNLEIFYDLSDSSANKIAELICNEQDSISIDFQLPDQYKIFETRLISQLYVQGMKIKNPDSYKIPQINYVIDEASVYYDEPFKSGLFGSYYIKRNFKMNGSIIFIGNTVLTESYSFSYADTIEYNMLNTVENTAYPFTTGNKPTEPFFSSIFEPAIFVGAAAIAVYLFFTVRGK
jgi:hypothetical protein